MEENQIIVDIGLDAFIQSLRNLQKQYELNTAALKAMKDAGEEQSDAYITLTQEQKVLRQQMASTEKSIQNEIKMQQAQEGSLVQLRAQLANLQKQYDSMSGMERMGEAGVALQKKIKSLHDEVLGLEGDTGRMQRNVGNYPNAVQPLREELERLTKQLEDLRAENKEGSDEFAAVEKRIGEVNQSITQLTGKVEGLATDTGNVKQQMRELTENLIAMKMRGEENTEQYRQMLEQLGKMKDAMADAQREVKQMASDTGTLNSVLDAAKLATGAFSAALGIFNIVGDKDSKTAQQLAEAQKKLQAAIAVTTGLQAVQNALQKESALMMGIHKIQVWAAAKAQDEYAAATGRATIAQRVFNTVAKANPYVLLAGIILTVVGAIAAFTAGSKEQEEQLEETNEKLRTQISLLKQLNEQYQSLRSVATDEIDYQIQMAEATGASAETINKLKIAKLDYLQAALDADKRTAESAILQYSAVNEAYQDNLSQMKQLIVKRAVLLAQGDKDGAEWVQKDIDRLQEQMDKQKELIDYVDSLTKRQYAINLERERISNQTTNSISNNIKTLKRETQELIKIATSEELYAKIEERNRRFAESIKKVVDRVGLLKTEFESLKNVEVPEFDLPEINVDDSNLPKPTALDEFSAAFQRNAEDIMETSSALESSFGSLSSMYQNMAKDERKSEEEREEAARKAKAWAKIQVATNAATAVAKGVASAVDVGFPAAIPAMATMLAAILSAIAQAKALASEAGSYEHGGVIGNKFIGATRGKDDVTITARRGEMMLDADQQKRLYDIANGSATTNLTASLVEALQAMPAPVLVYSEYKRFTDRVATLDDAAKLH